MNGFVDIYTIIFLVIAIVIFLRLRSVLGRRTGNERQPFDPFSRTDKPAAGASPGDDKVIAMPRRSAGAEAPAGEVETAAEARIKTMAPEGSPLAEGLRAIAGADRSFDPDSFIGGARGAYEMIVTAFAEGDRKTLKPLLSREVFDGFNSAISEREARGETIESTFVGIDKADIVEASMKGSIAQVTVRLQSELISATRDKDGHVIDGDPNRVTEVVDIWTFARDTTTRDPNWKLVATESAG